MSLLAPLRRAINGRLQGRPTQSQVARRTLSTYPAWPTLLHSSNQLSARHAIRVGARARAALSSIQERLAHFIRKDPRSMLNRRLAFPHTQRAMLLRQIGHGSRLACAGYIEHSPRPAIAATGKASLLAQSGFFRLRLQGLNGRLAPAAATLHLTPRETVLSLTRGTLLFIPLDLLILVDQIDGWLLRQIAEWVLRLFGWHVTLVERIQQLLQEVAHPSITEPETIDPARAAALARLERLSFRPHFAE